MSTPSTRARRARDVGRALAAAGLAVVMLTGVTGTATAGPVPTLTINEEYGRMPNGDPIRDFRALDTTTREVYSSNGRQYAQFARQITWSEQAQAVRVQLQPRAFDYKHGWFWFDNNYRVESSSTATLTGPNGYSRTVRRFQVTTGTSGAWMHEYIPFGTAARGTYCLNTVGTVKGIGGSQETLKNSRSVCFTR